MESIILLLQQHLFLDNGRRLHDTRIGCTMNRSAEDGFFTACMVNSKLSTPELEVRRVQFCNQVHVQRQVETPKVRPPWDYILKHLSCLNPSVWKGGGERDHETMCEPDV